MLCSPVQVLLPLLLLLLVVIVAMVDSGCVFPASLQTNSTLTDGGPARDWVGRVREQFTQFGVHIVVAGNVLRVTSTDSASRRSYILVCLQVSLLFLALQGIYFHIHGVS